MPWLPEAIWKRRLESELVLMSESNSGSFSCSADKTVYEIVLNGPGLSKEGGTVSKRGTHLVRVLLKREFPYAGGIEVTWLSPIFHPNIRSEDGKVCIKLINQWAEGQTVKQVVDALKQLLENPNPASPLNHEAADYFEANPNALNFAEPPAFRKPRIVG
ncbi:TPA: hypothetical protein HA318_01140 [Candidatus Micrarchaeota archaeon]|nr:MAG: hypothetical protein AUJ65_00900 [Candidatus Micrarchaeota archaeon CG1_02_51_15]HII38592.1 hypothetical protein [Candidatus Micrarchaeota archaeon]